MYPGGKDTPGTWQRLINQIPPHDVFISAFLGDCALMRHKAPAAVNIGIDLDHLALTRFSAPWDSDAKTSGPAGGDAETRGQVPDLYRCPAQDWLAHAFDLYRHRQPPNPAASAEVAKPCGPSCRNARSTVARFGVPADRIFVYADPPYLINTRRNGAPLYRYEMTDAQHQELLSVLVRLPCPVMVSHYPCETYDDALHDWRSFTFRSMTRRGMATEKVWCNYPTPDALHDPRWLGTNKREREKLNRRRRNLINKIRRLSPLERQSLLAEL